MKTYGILCFIIAILMLASPLMSLDYSSFSFSNVKSTIAQSQNSDESADETEEIATKESASDDTVKVLATASGNVVTASTLEYIVGCVAAEMPASYSDEAIKAQAICAYTNLQRLKNNPDASLSGADISDSPSKHQGYYDTDTQKEKWGDKYNTYHEKIENDVKEVIGKTITYNGELIVAAYCAISPGRTASSAEIWGGDLAYLQSVTSPGDKLSPDYSVTVSLTAEQIREYTKNDPEIVLPEDESQWITDIINTDSGTGVVKSVVIGGKTFSGNNARALLLLRSPAFTLNYHDGVFDFSTLGYGHAVGLSQYGADYMAKQGSNYEEILKHYYTGISLT